MLATIFSTVSVETFQGWHKSSLRGFNFIAVGILLEIFLRFIPSPLSVEEEKNQN
jgi:hypothetical protein